MYVRGHNRVYAKLFHLEIHDANKDDLVEDLTEQSHISQITITGVRTSVHSMRQHHYHHGERQQGTSDARVPRHRILRRR